MKRTSKPPVIYFESFCQV